MATIDLVSHKPCTSVKINYEMTYDIMARYRNTVIRKPAFRFSQFLDSLTSDAEIVPVYYEEELASNVGPYKAFLIVSLKEYNDGHYDSSGFMAKYKPWVDILDGARFTADKLKESEFTTQEYSNAEIIKKCPKKLIIQLRGTEKTPIDKLNPYEFELYCYDDKYYTNIFKNKVYKLDLVYVRKNAYVKSIEFI